MVLVETINYRKLRLHLDVLHNIVKHKYLSSSMLEVVRYWYESRGDIEDTEVLALVAALYDFQMRVVTIKNNFMTILKYLDSKGLRFIDLSNEEVAREVFKLVKDRSKFFHRFDPVMRVLPILTKSVANAGLREVARRYSWDIELLTRKLLERVGLST